MLPHHVNVKCISLDKALSWHTAVVVLKDLRPLYAGRCEYYSSGTAFDLDVSCQPERSAFTSLQASEFEGYVLV